MYLDYAAATPVDGEVRELMEPFFLKIFGNPSSLHAHGRKTRKFVEQTRTMIAQLLHCLPKEIIFTTGGTESNNLAIQGVAFGQRHKGKHIITTNIEHTSVKRVCEYLEQQGWRITYLPVNAKGLITAKQVEEAIKPDTAFITIHYVNNEIGVVQPVPTMCERIKQRFPNVLIHTDACQAVNLFDLNMKKLGVDMLSVSGNKIYGPKGTGLLFMRKHVQLQPIFYGGEQEKGLRPGTENVAGIIGIGSALKKCIALQKEERKRLTGLQHFFFRHIKKIPKARINGDEHRRSPHIIHVSIRGVDTNSMLMFLDRKNISISSGSACQSGSFELSHVMRALGKSDSNEAHLRFSFGRKTTEEELQKAIETVKEAAKRLAKPSL